MKKISRALISFAFVADRFESTKGDIFQGLVPLLAPIVKARKGQGFDPTTFTADLQSHYDIVMPPAVAQDWAPRLEREGYLTREEITPGHIRYYYNDVPLAPDGPSQANVELLLAEFAKHVDDSPARLELPGSLDLEKELFDRLINLDSLAVFHRADKPHPIRRSKRTLVVRQPSNDEGTVTRNHDEERMDFLFGSFVEHVRASKPELFQIMSDVTTGALLSEVILGVQSPPSRGDEFETLDIYLDAPLVMDLLGINPGRKEYAEELISALKACKAPIWIFDHSVDEIERIITHRVEATTRAAAQRLGYRYRTPAAATDKLYLISIKGHVASELQKRGIKINSLQGDPYQRALKYFSEEDEEDLMSQIGMYLYVDAKEADAKSLAHVIRLRAASDVHPNVLRARAVLVSRNGRLVNRSARFLATKQATARQAKSSNTYRPGDAPICITDSYLLGLIWITRGGTTKSLSRSRLVANCAAAISPRRELVGKMFDLLLECDEQKADRFEAIMIDERAERYLMHLTLGDDSLVTNANVEELYEEVRRATAEELTQEHEQKLEAQRRASAAQAATLRAEYERKLAETERQASARNAQLRDQLLDEQSDGLQTRNQLSKIKEQYEAVTAQAQQIESKLQSERRQRLLPAFVEARAVRRRFPVLFGALLGAIFYAASKLIAMHLLGDDLAFLWEVALFALGVLGFCLGFWDIPTRLFSPLRDALCTSLFSARARRLGAGDLLPLYAADWDKDELIELPSPTSKDASPLQTG